MLNSRMRENSEQVYGQGKGRAGARDVHCPVERHRHIVHHFGFSYPTYRRVLRVSFDCWRTRRALHDRWDDSVRDLTPVHPLETLAGARHGALAESQDSVFSFRHFIYIILLYA